MDRRIEQALKAWAAAERRKETTASAFAKAREDARRKALAVRLALKGGAR